MKLITKQLKFKDMNPGNWKIYFFTAVVVPLVSLAGCTVGPKYQTPTVPTPEAYKETKDWKVATPQDAAIRAKWWEVYNDPQLSSLEETGKRFQSEHRRGIREFSGSASTGKRGPFSIFSDGFHCAFHHE